MMLRYVVFVGDPAGDEGDRGEFAGGFATMDEARAAILESGETRWEIVDLVVGETIDRGQPDGVH